MAFNDISRIRLHDLRLTISVHWESHSHPRYNLKQAWPWWRQDPETSGRLKLTLCGSSAVFVAWGRSIDPPIDRSWPRDRVAVVVRRKSLNFVAGLTWTTLLVNLEFSEKTLFHLLLSLSICLDLHFIPFYTQPLDTWETRNERWSSKRCSCDCQCLSKCQCM